MAENARDYLYNYTQEKNCDPWIKSVIFAFLDSDGNVNQEDKERLLVELLEDKSDEIIPASVLSKPIANQRVEFVSFQHIKGVNALAPNQIIRFGKDINIIYGLNGTGKSSYFRIINDIIGGARKKKIIGNIYLEEAEEPRAELCYKLNGNNNEYLWDNTVGAEPKLSTVRVFDTSYTAGLLKKRSSDDLLVKPFQLSLFSELISLVDELLILAQQRVSGDEQALPILDTQYFSPETKLLLSKDILSEEDEKKVRSLCCFDNKLSDRVQIIREEIEQLKQANVRDKISLEIEHKKIIIRLLEIIQNLEESLKRYKEKADIEIDGLRQKKRGSDEARLRFRSLNSIPGIDSEAWKTFIAAGKQYAEENNVKVCPYCRRSYDETALQLIESYSEYLMDVNEVEYMKQKDLVKELYYQVDHIRIPTKSEYSVDFLPEEVQEEIALFLNNASNARQELLHSLKEEQKPIINLFPVSLLLDQLKKFVSYREQVIEKLNADANTKEEQIKELTIELSGLLEKKSISEQMDTITTVIAGKRAIKQKRKLISRINTKKLSNLSKKAHDELLTKNLESMFKGILKDLNIKDVSIQLKSQNIKGTQQTELLIKGLNAIDDILSEGEQKATALALFLAEVLLSENHSTLVFDDPVNSMDHRMMGAFAEKILQLDNQVIVFTHNRMFLESFAESKNGHFCKTYDSACNKNKGRHILVYETLSEGRNSKGVISKKQIDRAKTYLDAVDELLKETPFTKKQEACSKLRFAAELLIDEVVFNGQVPTRYSTKSSRINWDGLKDISNDSGMIDTLKEVHGRCSGGELHNGIERNENPVEKSDVQEMLDKLRTILIH